MALSDLFGIDNSAGNADLKNALAAIQSVRPPTAAQLTLPELQKYVSAGVLTAAQYQAITADPDTYRQVIQATSDTSGSDAQKAALEDLSGIIRSGGSTPINQATLLNNINTTNQAMKGARGAIEQNANERGVSGGGLEFISKLMDEQNNSQNANTGAVNAASDNAKLALNAISAKGTLGGQLQGQSNEMTKAQADAAQQIAEYNSQLRSQANQYNVENANSTLKSNLANAQNISGANTDLANQRTQYNANVPQIMFQNDMSKAGAEAGIYGNMANMKQQQAQNEAGFTGGLLGTGAKLGAAYMTGGASLAPGALINTTGKANAEQTIKKNNGYCHGGEVQCYAEGGEVHDHQLCMAAGGEMPPEMGTDDSTANDTVDAKLSPGEIVLPRSVAQSPTAPQDAQQFVSQTKGMGGMPPPSVNSFSEVLAKLEENGLELRLAPKGA